MFAVCFHTDEPASHLACDDVILRRAEAGLMDECLRFYEVDPPTVVLGVAGRWEREVCVDACRRAGVPILRRASGGGAVLLASGCLNYSLVLDTRGRSALRGVRSSYQWVLARLVGALDTRGVHCRPAGLSDLAWNDRKVGGSAQKRRRHIVLHHGTLLYEFDIEQMARFLGEPASCPDYRAGRCHSEFVTNLPVGRAALQQAVGDAFDVDPAMPLLDLTGELAADVAVLVREKYGSDGWNLRR